GAGQLTRVLVVPGLLEQVDHRLGLLRELVSTMVQSHRLAGAVEHGKAQFILQHLHLQAHGCRRKRDMFGSCQERAVARHAQENPERLEADHKRKVPTTKNFFIGPQILLSLLYTTVEAD